MNSFIFSSESVSDGHSDKICDQISDAILDAYLKIDPFSRTAIETVVSSQRIYIFGEITGPSALTRKHVDEIVRECIRDIGYESPNFDWRTVYTEINLKTQPVAKNLAQNEGANDQGIMFGYATHENEAFMPSPLYFANQLLYLLAKDRHKGLLPQLGPDGKCQFSVKYEDRKPVGTSAIVVSAQHQEDLNLEDIKAIIHPYVEKVLPKGWFCGESSFFVNPKGQFIMGGPANDTGLTGRKIIADTYGGMAPHGGGAFSGKDPTKIDRSGAYIARHMAKNVVAAGLAARCTLQLSYAIGRAEPTSFYINTHGTGLISEDRLANVLRELVDLTPHGIRKKLALHKPIYRRTATYGHFGRDVDPDGGFSWEKLDLVEELKGAFL
ncbi:MAG: methionine adenosyltransferase [Alphaproteobacteria bacterium]|nr:methionine adenosyltransferase [Alphaproteobacteria bacterium]